MIILATKFNQSYVHIISPTAKLIIDNVFHNVCFLLLSIVENGCTYADICEVVPRPAISSSKYFLRSNIILECFFDISIT